MSNAHQETEPARMVRWAASLRRTAEATAAEAQRHGEDWEFYHLSMSSAAAQIEQAERFEALAAASGPSEDAGGDPA